MHLKWSDIHNQLALYHMHCASWTSDPIRETVCVLSFEKKTLGLEAEAGRKSCRRKVDMQSQSGENISRHHVKKAGMTNC